MPPTTLNTLSRNSVTGLIGGLFIVVIVLLLIIKQSIILEPSFIDRVDTETDSVFDFENGAWLSQYKDFFLNENMPNETYSSVYDVMFEMHSVDSLLSLDFNQRCELYFKILYSLDPNWRIDLHSLVPQFKSDEFQHFQNQSILDDKAINPETIMKKFAELKTKEYHPIVIDIISSFRIFNKCYLADPTNHQFIKFQNGLVEGGDPYEPAEFEKLTHLQDYFTFEKRMYPWLTGEWPIYEHWDGNVYFQPKLSPYSFWFNEFKQKLHGRGIVLTIGEKHVNYTVKLIRLLRAHKNQYPIQIFLDDNVSLESKQNIIDASRDDFFNLPPSYSKVQEVLGENYFNTSEGLPRQDIWFVNIRNAIVPSYWSRFRGFSQKLLANVFNSFEEYMLIDSDTALLESPDFFFNLEEFNRTGAYFFKDRSWDVRSEASIKYFESLGPSMLDTIMFGIPEMTNHTLNRDFFKGLSHYMESGVVLLNKKRHFTSVLMMLQLSLVQPILSQVYGEKELFWLGMVFNGDELYEFEPNFAAALGDFSKDGDTKEICSSHPAHLSSHDGHLLWLNSGFQFCQRADLVDYKTEAGYGDRFSNDPDELKQIFSSLLRPNHAIIPPISPNYTAIENDDHEPVTGWAQDRRYCKAKLYCAYSRIGGRDNPIYGKVITFNETEKNLIEYYSDIWMGGQDYAIY